MKPNHIAQNGLVIGGTANRQVQVTIAASDPSGNPLGQPSGVVFAGLLMPRGSFGAGSITSANLSSGGGIA